MKRNRILYGTEGVNVDQRLHNLHQQLSAAQAKGNDNRVRRIKRKIAERKEQLRPKPAPRPYQGCDIPLWQ